MPVQKHSDHPPRRFPCVQCDSAFNRLTHLKRHQKTHCTEKPFTCLYCSVSSSRKDVILRHSRNFHQDLPPNISVQRLATKSPRQQTRCSLPRPSVSASSDTASPPEACSMEAAAAISHAQDARNPSQSTLSPLPMQSTSLTLDLDPSDISTYASSMMPSILQSNHPQDKGFDAGTDFSFHSSSMEQIFQSDIFLPTSLGDPNTAFPGVLNERDTVPGLFPSHPDTQQLVSSICLEDTDYALIQANVTRFEPDGELSNFGFPSKYGVLRFVKAFFSHMALNLPIVHGPTFDSIAAPAPLLLEIMACGALYVNQPVTATKMHMAALRFLSENDKISLSQGDNGEYQMWQLQAYLLATYFEFYCGGLCMDRQIYQMFCRCVQLAQNAIERLTPSDPNTYEEWVYQETIRRCIASCIIIGSSISSTLKRQYVNVTFINCRFPLPSTPETWTMDKKSWQQPPTSIVSSDAARQIFAGQKPDSTITEFGFLTIIASVLYQICSFDSYTGPSSPGFYADFTCHMSKTLQSIDEIWRDWMSEQNTGEAAPTALLQCTRALLDSAFYHLYGNQHLATMKTLLYSWKDESVLDELERLDASPPPSTLHVALLRAADSMRADCRMGIKYLRKIAPFRFSPMSANAISEGCLLLCWYLRAKQSCHPVLERNPVVEVVIDESAAELEELQNIIASQVEVLPLAVAAELLKEDSVWQWPPALARKLMDLIPRLQLS